MSETHREPFVHLVDLTPSSAHALLVEIGGDELRITTVSGVDADGRLQRMTAQTPDGAVVAPPFVVRA